MSQSFEILLKLLRGEQIPAQSPEMWEEIHLQASRQAVLGIAFDGALRAASGELASLGVSEELEQHWRGEIERIEAACVRVEKVAAAQQLAWEKREIDALILKGLTVAGMYPVPRHRMPGDIDWWFPSEEDWTKARAVVEENSLTPVFDSDGDFHYKLSGVFVEHHRKGLEAEGPAGVLLYLSEHILRHAMVFGVGLKQVLDYCVALNFYEGLYERDEYLALAASRGLTRWTALLEDLGAGTMNRDVRNFLELVERDGNFGFGKKRRWSGLWARLGLFLRVAPGRLLQVWGGLVRGRLRRIFCPRARISA